MIRRMDYLGVLEPPSRGRARLGGSQAAQVMVPGPLARALASELSRCQTGSDRPGALPGTPGHTRASLTVFLWLKGLSVRKLET